MVPAQAMIREANRDPHRGRSVPAHIRFNIDDDEIWVLPPVPQGRGQVVRVQQLERACNNAQQRGRSLPACNRFLELIVPPRTTEHRNGTTNINGSYHHTNPNLEIMMHQGQDNFLPTLHIICIVQNLQNVPYLHLTCTLNAIYKAVNYLTL